MVLGRESKSFWWFERIADLKEEMVADYIYPTLKTGAYYEGKYLLGTSMARPIIAKVQVEVAS
ncbi:argininosuccinate synthase [Vibrio lentus]|nr:argininosuccinate synthase [Vibrio lentus]